MKRSLADQVRAFLAFKGENFTPGKLAAEVAKRQEDLPASKRCRRQNIEQLLEKNFQTVRYITALASAMGTNAETLAAGQYLPGAVHGSGTATIDVLSSASGTVSTLPPLNLALEVVLNALAQATNREELKQLLPMIVDTNAAAYRTRLLELLEQQAEPNMR